MCGITGWANLDARATPFDGATHILHAMCERLTHRGPDSEGAMTANGVALGMRRLAVIDLMTGEQPATSEDGQVSVVLNGEIYNYREVRARLEKRGHRFRSHSATRGSRNGARTSRDTDMLARSTFVKISSAR